VIPDVPAPAKKPPKRYAPDVPLPTARYAPGSERTHPLDPDGHMRAIDVPDVEVVSEMAWMVNPRWLYGVDLYNNWFFWEAHEVWEPLWKALDKAKPPGLFLQGLMQASGGVLKAHVGDLDGAQAFWGQAETRLGKCADATDTLWGIKTVRTFKAFRKYFAPAADGRVPPLDKRVPSLKLRM
jgi:hypothetical protein